MAHSSSNVSNPHMSQTLSNDSHRSLGVAPSVFERDDPLSIAQSLKQSADQNARRRTGPYRSAMSMLTFYINRTGSQLSAHRRKILEQAKDELRSLYGKPRKGSSSHG
ncbi:DUF3175 domain-containing protein [Xanthomonas sp. GPE 39]|uniref:DUF3175 domain-containing protein n=2 Tax=unclassified Xanthomonas TaxID=2643310 RepID=UPI0005F2C2D0|nr:DUF3175 domain-containing protein [Xanthomonas sp. GPE 39]